jgi:ATP-dependent 26S proteasome regulatory subunit
LQIVLTFYIVREGAKQLKKDYDKTEDDLKALQSVGQIIGEVLKQLDEERCNFSTNFAFSLIPFSHC